MKIATCGCSQSAYNYGTPWHEYMKKSLNCKVVSSSSGGSGNEVNLEKLKHILDNHTIDYIVIQLTEPSRMVIGVNPDVDDKKNWISHSVGGESCFPYFTFGVSLNDFNIKQRFKCGDIKFDNFYHKKVITSYYNTTLRFFHTLMSFQKLSEIYDTKIIFFSWYVDVRKLAEETNNTKLIKDMTIIDGCVRDFIENNNISYTKDNTHVESEGHELIYKNFLEPELIKIIK
jgi:hypothetical protein